MAGPPDDVSAKDLFLKLTEPKPTSEPIDFPRKNRATGKPFTRLRIQVLSQLEHERARIEAHRKLRERYNLKTDEMGDITIREVAGDAIAREVLAMACVHESPIKGSEDDESGPKYPRMFRDAEHVSELTAHEIVVLFNAYLLVQEKFGPFESDPMTPEDLNKWIKRLEEGGSELPLLSMSLPQLVQLAYLLAARNYSLFHTLSTQWQSLPDTLKSTLRASCGDISSFGKPADDSESDGSVSYEPSMSGEPISLEDAVELARRLVQR
jgi:hypothetical protein